MEVDDKSKPSIPTQARSSVRAETLNNKEIQALKDMLARFPQIEESLDKIKKYDLYSLMF